MSDPRFREMRDQTNLTVKQKHVTLMLFVTHNAESDENPPNILFL